MRIHTLVILSALSLGGVAPAFAQDPVAPHDQMKPQSAMKMSAADTRKMKACHALSAAKMARNAACTNLMKAHPDMMQSHGNMMSSGH